MKQILSLFALLSVFVMAMALSGCGEGGSGGNNSPAGNTSTNQQQGDLAPASVDGKTFNGRIGTTTTTWRIVLTGSGNSGTYSYSENGRFLDSGNYTYTKTGSSTAVLTLTDGTTLQLTFTAPNGGNYLITKSSETGTFTTT